MQTEVRPIINHPVQQPARGNLYRRYIKRPMDFILSSCAIIVLLPVLFVVALLVRCRLGSPIIFKQKRPGLNERIFTLYKFRTMTYKKDQSGELLLDEMRLTKFGKFLRSTSLDELPELWNIVRGDMSLVGPRPLLVQYLPLYNDHQKRRHDVRPGLSSLAAINGRNTLTWEEKFEYDIAYIKNISLALDMRIILTTICVAVKREGINQESCATVDEFTGS